MLGIIPNRMSYAVSQNRKSADITASTTGDSHALPTPVETYGSPAIDTCYEKRSQSAEAAEHRSKSSGASFFGRTMIHLAPLLRALARGRCRWRRQRFCILPILGLTLFHDIGSLRLFHWIAKQWLCDWVEAASRVLRRPRSMRFHSHKMFPLVPSLIWSQSSRTLSET